MASMRVTKPNCPDNGVSEDFDILKFTHED